MQLKILHTWNVIAAAMKEDDLSQAETATAVGESASSLSELKNRRAGASVARLAEIVSRLPVAVSEAHHAIGMDIICTTAGVWRIGKLDTGVGGDPASALAAANLCVARPTACAQLLVDVLDNAKATPGQVSEAVAIMGVCLHRHDRFGEAQMLYQAELARELLSPAWRVAGDPNPRPVGE